MSIFTATTQWIASGLDDDEVRVVLLATAGSPQGENGYADEDAHGAQGEVRPAGDPVVERLPGAEAEAGRRHHGDSHAEDDEPGEEPREAAEDGPADEALARIARW